MTFLEEVCHIIVDQIKLNGFEFYILPKYSISDSDFALNKYIELWFCQQTFIYSHKNYLNARNIVFENLNSLSEDCCIQIVLSR